MQPAHQVRKPCEQARMKEDCFFLIQVEVQSSQKSVTSEMMVEVDVLQLGVFQIWLFNKRT